MRFVTLSALALGSAFLVGCAQDAPTTPESLTPGEAVFNQGKVPGGGGGGGEEILEWYIEFSDAVEGDDRSLDIKVYHYSSHVGNEASGSGTAQVLKTKDRLDVDSYDGDDADLPYVTVYGVTTKGESFDLTFSDTDDCAPEVEGVQKQAKLVINGTEEHMFCGNITS